MTRRSSCGMLGGLIFLFFVLFSLLVSHFPCFFSVFLCLSLFFLVCPCDSFLFFVYACVPWCFLGFAWGCSCFFLVFLCMNLIPDAPCFLVSVLHKVSCATQSLIHIRAQAVFHSIRVLEKGISSDPQHLSCLNPSMEVERRWGGFGVVWSGRTNDVLWSATDVLKELKSDRNAARSLLA